MTKKTNFNELYKAELGGLKTRPRLLLHCCCAPCTAGVLDELVKSFEVCLYFYNPNLTDEGEYERRLQELYTLAESRGIKQNVLAADYKHAEFLAAAIGLEAQPERGERCRACIALRLNKAALAAVQQGCDYVCTTLSISPLKDAEFINAAGERLAGLLNAENIGGGAKRELRWLPADFKKEERNKIAVAVVKQLGLYRQSFCGCEFSKR